MILPVVVWGPIPSFFPEHQLYGMLYPHFFQSRSILLSMPVLHGSDALEIFELGYWLPLICFLITDPCTSVFY